MKIIAIGRNYVKHIEELNNERPDEPVIFTKPDSALLRNNDDFYYPEYSKDIHYEVEVLIKICKVGKNIEERFAHKYYDEVGVGIDFTARDLQSIAKKKGLPWDLAKGFHGSAPVSAFLPKDRFDMNNLNFGLSIDEKRVQQGNTSHMIFDFDYLISYISKFITLKKGDIIFTGTPEGVGPVQIGNRLEVYLEDEKMMDFEVK